MTTQPSKLDVVNSLPFGLETLTLSFLNVADLGRCSGVSSQWKKFLENPDLWHTSVQPFMENDRPQPGESVRDFARRKWVEHILELRRQRAEAEREKRREEFTSMYRWASRAALALSVPSALMVVLAYPVLSRVLLGGMVGVLVARYNLVEWVWQHRYGRPALALFVVAFVGLLGWETGKIHDVGASAHVRAEAKVLLYLVHSYRYFGLFVCLACVVYDLVTRHHLHTLVVGLTVGGGFWAIGEGVLWYNGVTVLDYEPFFWEALHLIATVWAVQVLVSGLVDANLTVLSTWTLGRRYLVANGLILLARSMCVFVLADLPSPRWLWLHTALICVRGVLPHGLVVYGVYRAHRYILPRANTWLEKEVFITNVTFPLVLEALLVRVFPWANSFISRALVTILERPSGFLHVLRSFLTHKMVYSVVWHNKVPIWAVASTVTAEFVLTPASGLWRAVRELAICVALLVYAERLEFNDIARGNHSFVDTGLAWIARMIAASRVLWLPDAYTTLSFGGAALHSAVLTSIGVATLMWVYYTAVNGRAPHAPVGLAHRVAMFALGMTWLGVMALAMTQLESAQGPRPTVCRTGRELLTAGVQHPHY